MAIRKIKKTIEGSTQYDGAGVKLVRVIGRSDVEAFDPFLMLDAFDSTNPSDYIKGFPWHPHRGIETVTYLIHGDIEHGDSLGNKGRITDGSCQWMTAGSGIIHQEMPQPCERMLGVQLWLNLPARDKMTEPRYHDITAQSIPVVQENGAKIKIIAGAYKDQVGAAQGDYVSMHFLDVMLEPGALWQITTDSDDTAFLYVVEGEGRFDDAQRRISAKKAVLFDQGEEIVVTAAEAGLRFLLLMGKPLGEPIAWGGPIVMNTREELQHAFAELDAGTFIKHKLI